MYLVQKQEVFGNNYIIICSELTVLEKEIDKMNGVRESKFHIPEILLKFVTVSSVYQARSVWK